MAKKKTRKKAHPKKIKVELLVAVEVDDLGKIQAWSITESWDSIHKLSKAGKKRLEERHQYPEFEENLQLCWVTAEVSVPPIPVRVLPTASTQGVSEEVKKRG